MSKYRMYFIGTLIGIFYFTKLMPRVFLLLLILCASTPLFAQTDSLPGTSAPTKVSGNVSDLAWYLCDGVIGDTAKAYRLYNWVTHNIAFDIKASKDPDREPANVQNVLKDKKAVSDGYALLYAELCKTVGLEAVPIAGYVKSWLVDNGDQFLIPGHEWCAVKIDRRWELVDPTFGAGGISFKPDWLRTQLNLFSKDDVKFDRKEVFEFQYNPEYFLKDPVDFRRTHLPEDPMWQLAQTTMPLDVFEEGDSAIVQFNKENPGRINRARELEHIATLNRDQRIVELADRAYKFNDSFDMIMAVKEQINSAEVLRRYLSHRNMPQRVVIEDAYKGAVLAEKYLEKQKSYFTDYYLALKKKNIDKSRLAKEHTRDVTVLNKQLSAQCKRRLANAERKKNVLDNRQDKTIVIANAISPQKIDSIKTITVQKDKNTPMMVALSDSLRAKQARLKKSNFYIIDKIQAITVLQEESNQLMDTFQLKQQLSDTILKTETAARLEFRDSYDDDVRLYVQLFRQLRIEDGNELLNTYLLNFDTLIVYYEELQKLYDDQVRLYKSLFREMEQYRRWNNTEDFIVTTYAIECKRYGECLSQYQQTMEVYENYLNKNIELLNGFIATYENELALTEKIDKAEAARKDAEDKEIEERRSYDERINQKQQESVARLKEQLTEILSR